MLLELPARANTSTNWAGYVDKNPATYYDEAYGEYIEPSLSSLYQCSNNAAYFWSGLGLGNPNLAQDGTGIGAGLQKNQFWFEILPGGPVPIVYTANNQPFTATPNDYVVAYTQWAGPDGNGGNIFHFYLADGHTGNTFNMNVPTSSGFDGSTAEYIAERPGYDPDQDGDAGIPDNDGDGDGEGTFTLNSFGTFNQSQAYTDESGTFYSADLLPNDFYNMLNLAQTNYLAYVSNAITTGGAFSVSWHACS